MNDSLLIGVIVVSLVVIGLAIWYNPTGRSLGLLQILAGGLAR